MERPLTHDNVRALLARSGLMLPEDRLEQLVSAVELARTGGRVLAEREMGFLGPPAFRPPEPESRPTDPCLPDRQARDGG